MRAVDMRDQLLFVANDAAIGCTVLPDAATCFDPTLGVYAAVFCNVVPDTGASGRFNVSIFAGGTPAVPNTCAGTVVLSVL